MCIDLDRSLGAVAYGGAYGKRLVALSCAGEDVGSMTRRHVGVGVVRLLSMNV